MSITLEQLSEALGFTTSNDLDTRYSTTQVLTLFDSYDIQDYLEWESGYESKSLSDYSDAEIQDEFEARGLSDLDSREEIEKIVQAHRMGLLKVEGKHADLLLNWIYELANKVV